MNKIRLKTPATTANLGPGFDVFALALREPYDLLEVEKISSGIELEVDGYPIPEKPLENCAGYVANEMMQAFKLQPGVKIKIKKMIPPGSGLGSSAASSAGTAFALDQLFNLNLTSDEIALHAAQGETVSAGFPHCDNVGACIIGGFTLTYSYDPLQIVGIPPPKDLGVVVVLPNIAKGSTKVSRSVVPKQIPREHLTHNVGHASLLAAGIALGRLDYVKKGMNDCIVEPARAKAGILPEFPRLKRVGEQLNAGIAASGAGPAILGIIEKDRRNELAESLSAVFNQKKYSVTVYITEPGPGIQVITGRNNSDG